MACSTCCAEVAARAFGAAVDRAVFVVMPEVPVARVDGLVASPAVQCLAGVHASLVGGACALVGGVGVAVGRAVRTAIVVVTILNFFIGLAIWGTSTSVRIAG